MSCRIDGIDMHCRIHIVHFITPDSERSNEEAETKKKQKF